MNLCNSALWAFEPYCTDSHEYQCTSVYLLPLQCNISEYIKLFKFIVFVTIKKWKNVKTLNQCYQRNDTVSNTNQPSTIQIV